MKTPKSPFKKVMRELIIVKRIDEPNDKTAGGIIIPENQREKPTKAIVLHVGPGAWRRKKNFGAWLGGNGPMELKVGDKIIFKNEACWAFKIGGEEFIGLREGDAMAVYE